MLCKCSGKYIDIYFNLKITCFKGEELVMARSLICHVTEVAGVQSFENLNKTDVILSSSEAEDLTAAVWSIVEATFWMDWWNFAMKLMALIP